VPNNTTATQQKETTMSIETQLAELTAALNRNSAAIERWFTAFEDANAALDSAGAQPEQTTAPVQAPTPPPAPAVVEKAAPVLTVVDAPTVVTHGAVSDICARLMQASRTNGPKIKAALAKRNGARVVSDVPPEQLPELAAELEALL
jgi:hypothetical protein